VRRIAVARLVSLIGTDASAVALSFGLYAETKSATWMAASLLVTIGFGAVFGPIAGVIGDRVDRRRLMVTCEVAASACFVAMALFHSPWALLGLSVVATLVGCIFGPAAAAAIPSLAGDRNLAWANALVAGGSNFGKLVGRIGGGALVAVVGVAGVFWLDAVTFLVSAGLVATTRGQFGTRASRDAVAESGGVREAVAFLRRRPTIYALVLSSCACTLMTSFSMTAETPLAFAFGAGALGLGMLTALWCVGMLAGSWYAARALHAGNEVTAVLSGRLVMGVALAGVSLSPEFWPVLACYAAGGAGSGFLLIAAQNAMQRETPDAMRARVFALADSAKTAALGVGVVSAGALIGAFGPQAVYGFVGLGVLLGAAPLVALVRRLGGLRSLHPRAARERHALAPA
jgi:predicted MFS family arabinose efflux permease